MIRLTPDEAAVFNAVDADVAAKVIADTGGDAEAVVEALKVE